MPTLHIRLLGNFSLVYGDTPVTTVNTSRLQSLLAYLALHRDAPQSRQHFAFLLWPDSVEKQARTNLRNLLHLLRHALPEPDRYLHADTHTAQWMPHGPYTLDVDAFEQGAMHAASPASLREAVDLYRGDLMPACYDDWIQLERERLCQLYIDALERLVRLLEHERDYPTAIAYARRLLRHEPLREDVYRRLMRLHAANGDRAGALRAYHECATTLQRELGIEPGPSVQALYRHLLKLGA